MKKLFVIISLLVAAGQVYAQKDIFGKWKTIDDDTNKPESIVEIYEKDGQAYGKIIKLFRGPDEEQDPICDECPDDRKNKKIIGMEIIRDMEFNQKDEEWEDGEIMDPKNGESYDCVIWREDENTLKVRGYVAFFYRTQTWVKVD